MEGSSRRGVGTQHSQGRKKAVAELAHGLDELWLVHSVAEGRAQLENASLRSLLRTRCIRPDRPHQLIAGDQAAGVLDEVAQHGEGLGPQRHLLLAIPESLIEQIEPKRPEADGLLTNHPWVSWPRGHSQSHQN